METKALAMIDTFQFPIQGEETGLYDPEEFEGIAPEFPRVKIPAGGQLSFEVPNPDDPEDPTPMKTLEGVIVLQHTANSYWAEADANGQPPDCASADGEAGYGNPGGRCGGCPLNQFGSGEGGLGKACKNMKNLYLLRSGDRLPLLLSLPPTSLKGFRQYANTLRLGGRGLSAVVTSIGLKRQESGGNSYSVATFRMAGELAPGLAAAGRAFGQSMRESLRAQRAAQTAPPAAYGTAPAGMDRETGELPAGERF